VQLRSDCITYASPDLITYRKMNELL
jgi:hypothetical protein